MDSTGKLISLIVPCYNIAGICDRFFESLLKQSYTHIQLIFVNDGSTDGTEKKIFSFQSELENKGYIFEYIYQENRGLGGAINTGLKKIQGEFFCWADSDDYFEYNSFELRLQYMLEHPECAILSSDAYVRNDKSLEEFTLYAKNFFHNEDRKQFIHLIEYNSIFCSGCHMVRTQCFKCVNPKMEIYEARRGQNWQILMPMYYNFDRHFLDIPLYNYIVYKNSMSHSDITYSSRLSRYDENETIITETLNRMLIPDDEKNKLIVYVHLEHRKLKWYLAKEFHEMGDYSCLFRELLKNRQITVKDWIRYVLTILH